MPEWEQKCGLHVNTNGAVWYKYRKWGFFVHGNLTCGDMEMGLLVRGNVVC